MLNSVKSKHSTILLVKSHVGNVKKGKIKKYYFAIIHIYKKMLNLNLIK